jgi:hypothetical protein
MRYAYYLEKNPFIWWFCKYTWTTILLGTTVFQVVPNLNRCPRGRRINGRVKLLASWSIHKTNRVSTLYLGEW